MESRRPCGCYSRYSYSTALIQHAAVGALPRRSFLVSSQLETLLGGLEDGKIRTWAKPAVDLVESQLQDRGMSASTVGRDALFNAIIQSAIPIAQANATALQQRSAQNLTNEQQANLQTAQLESSGDFRT